MTEMESEPLMATWYEHQRRNGNNVWVYSERGLMSFLLWHLLADHLDFVLDQAHDVEGTWLRDVVAACDHHTTLTEYEIGPQGFGSPDGSVVIRTRDRRFFVFVEAKAGRFQDSYLNPPIMTAEQLAAPQAKVAQLCKDNKFNSSINGQLELRWRFVNAFQEAIAANDVMVTEQRVPAIALPDALLQADRFYWRLFLQPNRVVAAHWRRVYMGDELQCLYDLMRDCEFLLLAVTFDQDIPDFRNTLRLFDGQGRLDVAKRVFWLNGQLIEAHLGHPIA
jgi:hypothetical protein